MPSKPVPEQQKQRPPNKSSSSSSSSSTQQRESNLPKPLQQQILTHFNIALQPLLSPSPSSPPNQPPKQPLQTHPEEPLTRSISLLKSHLRTRAFTTAFSNPANLPAYAARWTPTRALAYTQLLLSERETIGLVAISDHGLKVVCLGGGAGAEIVALAAALGQQSSLLLRGDLVPETVSGVLLSGGRKRRLDLRIFDAAPWECVLDSLADGLGALFLPEDKKEKEKEEDDEGWEVGYAFHRVDLLSPSLLGSSSSSVSCSPVARDGDGSSGLLREALRGAGLVTLFFTLNELYASSVARTTGLLLALGDWVEQGGRMCVVDSAGSYAVVSLGESEGDRKNNDETKRYPMAWMLDHTLLELAGKDKTDGGKVWKKVLTDESRWFRRDKTCDYPLQLEDMRYQVHIYEKL